MSLRAQRSKQEQVKLLLKNQTTILDPLEDQKKPILKVIVVQGKLMLLKNPLPYTKPNVARADNKSAT